MGNISRQELNNELNNELDKIKNIEENYSTKEELQDMNDTLMSHLAQNSKLLGVDKIISVKDPKIKAVGDGLTDDTTAIQKAFDTTGERIGIYFPPGTYVVTPKIYNDYILKAVNKKGIYLFGCGELSVIKVKENSGNYKGIIGAINTTVDVDFFEVESLTFDHNGQNNILPTLSDYEGQVRSTVSNYPSESYFNRISVRNCKIFNADSIVSLYFVRGTGDVNLIKITNTDWFGARNANGQDFDQSFINTNSDSLIVTDCTFEGESWELSPRTAIETHSSNCIVSNNTIRKFQFGANLTGIETTRTTLNQICSNNTFDLSRSGIIVWSQQLNAQVLVGFQNMVISNNVININPYNWNFEGFTTGCKGIAVYGGSISIPYENLFIKNNIVRYEKEVGTSYFERISGTKSYGAISCDEGTNTQNLAKNFTIEGNTVINCPISAIFIENGKMENLTITNNEFIDCSSTISTSTATSNKRVVWLATHLGSDCVVSNNIFRITDLNPTATHFMYLRDKSESGFYYKVLNNTFILNQNANLSNISSYVGLYNANVKLVFKGNVPNDTIKLPIMFGGTGSMVVSESNGVTYKKVDSSINWHKELTSDSIPTQGEWRKGDIVKNTNTDAGGYAGWVCVTTGNFTDTPPVFKGYGLIEA